MRSVRPLALALLVLPACAEPARDASGPARRVDKAGLYGDPGLVPSRAGERARNDLALTADLERGLASTPGVDAVRVVVRTEDHRPRIVIGLDRTPEADAVAVERAALDRVELLVPEAEILLESQPPPTPARTPARLSFALALALLGLGSSMGILLERLRQRGFTRG